MWRIGGFSTEIKSEFQFGIQINRRFSDNEQTVDIHEKLLYAFFGFVSNLQ